MPDWLSRLAGRSVSLENPTGLSKDVLKLLGDDLSLIDKKHKGLGQVLLKYVVDGEGDEVLLKLRGLPDAAKALRLRYRTFNYDDQPEKHSKKRQAIFERIDRINPVVLYRYAQVLHAAWSALPNKDVQWPHLPPDLEWLEVIVIEGVCLNLFYMRAMETFLEAKHLVPVLEAGGHSTGALVDLILLDEPRYGYAYYSQPAFGHITGLTEYFASHPKEVVNALKHPKAQHRAHVLKFLLEQKTRLEGEVLREVVNLGLGSAKMVREAAGFLLLGQSEETQKEAAGLVRAKAESGSAPERTHSIGLLYQLEGEACLPFLKERREEEKSKKTLTEIDRYLQMEAVATEEGGEGGYDDCLEVPEPKEYPTEYDLSPEIEQALVEAFERFNAKAIEEHAKWWDRADSRFRRGSRKMSPPASSRKVKKVVQGMKTPELVKKRKCLLPYVEYPGILHRELCDFLDRHPLDLVPLIRLGFCVGLIGDGNTEGDSPSPFHHSFHIRQEVQDWISEYRQRQDPDLSLLDLGSALSAAGLGEAWVTQLYLAEYYHRPNFNPLNLSDDAIWPFFYKNSLHLEQALGIREEPSNVFWINELRKRAYKVLTTFPRPPKKYAAHLWEQALGTSKTERPLAQACLKDYPGKEKLIINALEDGRKDVRASAAAWLGELNVTEAVPAITKALKKEKHDEPKAAMMEALEGLGEDIDKFLNRKKLKEEAEKGLKKEIHKDLAWFPFDRLPVVHWEKNRQQVPPEVLKWFVVQCFRLKSPEPGPLHRRYFALMRPNERKALGKFVLDAWLTQDTLPRYTHEEAEQEAEKQLAQTKQQVKQYPQYYQDFDEDQSRKAYLNHCLNECLGSANASKGILAIPAACCDGEIVPIVERYLKQWYGYRMAQCKAFIQMLSWVNHPLAIQLILAVGTRFRTKGIQKEAAKYADLIAERNEWTRDEMADRTIPTAGFERDGTQVIDYGQRQFTVKLLEDFSIQLENADGKVVKNLPNANKLEDEEEVKALKKDFTASKKELKQVLKFQEERLYEAMCAQRGWRYEDWDLYLNGHPIVGRFCQRIVWLAYRDGEIVASFRPLGDGSLTDYDDEEVNLEPDDLIQVAHQASLSMKDGEKWQESLKDYEVDPLFEQFGRKQFTLEGELGKEASISEFEGHLVNSFKLRGRANKLGYTRGNAEDGGWFYTYSKNFAGLNLQAVIEFSGNVLPEEDRTVALRSLYFTSIKNDGEDDFAYAHRPLRLSKVPEVLLSETWNDIKQMAEDGSGFDAEWEKKCGW